MPSDLDSPWSRATEYITNNRFHRRFTLPATQDHNALTISYADAGRAPDSGSQTSPPTLLFMPGMFASRYLSVYLHMIAEKLGVRVLVVDRPGMGYSTDVPLPQRISIWIELVPRLLTHLNIEHVALASHSAGAMYLFNTLYQCRNILHPARPFVAILAPWVNPSHSGITMMQMAQYLPVKAFSVWHHIPRILLTQAEPALSFSGAVFTKFSGMISSCNSSGDSALEKNHRKIEEDYGIPVQMQDELDSLVFKSMFDETTVGANSEALQCLRKGPGWTWGKCDDYETFVRELVALERSSAGASGGTAERAKLKVRAYFAESDVMIGTKGQNYMENCWNGTEDEDFQAVLDFAAETKSGFDHETLVHSVDTLVSIFVDAGGDLKDVGR